MSLSTRLVDGKWVLVSMLVLSCTACREGQLSTDACLETEAPKSDSRQALGGIGECQQRENTRVASQGSPSV